MIAQHFTALHLAGVLAKKSLGRLRAIRDARRLGLGWRDAYEWSGLGLRAISGGATTQVALSFPSGVNVFKETDLIGTALAVKAAAGTLFLVEIDNTANAAISYVKLWDLAAGSVTVGTTVPDWVLKVPASVKRLFLFDPTSGVAFATALAAACVTAGGTGGTTGPTSDVVCTIVYS